MQLGDGNGDGQPMDLTLTIEKRCVFEAYGKTGRHRCTRCGFVTPVTKWPPHKVHRHCQRGRASIGLGDTVEWLIKKITFGRVKPCAACKGRRSRLNRLVPYGHSWAWWRKRLRIPEWRRARPHDDGRAG